MTDRQTDRHQPVALNNNSNNFQSQ